MVLRSTYVNIPIAFMNQKVNCFAGCSWETKCCYELCHGITSFVKETVIEELKKVLHYKSII